MIDLAELYYRLEDDGANENSLFVPEDGNEHKKRKLVRDASQQYYSNHNPAEYDLDPDDTIDKQGSGIGANEANGSLGEAPEVEQVLERRQQSPLNEEDRAGRHLLMAMTKETNEHSEKKSKKKRSGIAKTAKEAHQKNRSKVKVKATKAPGISKTKTKAGKNTKIKKTPKPKSVKLAEKKKTVKRATGGYGATAGGSDLLINLLHNNAIQDRLAQGDFGVAPVIFENKDKGRMLKELIASVPADHKRHVTNDKRDLLQASKNFGYNKVTADGGKWKLKVRFQSRASYTSLTIHCPGHA